MLYTDFMMVEEQTREWAARFANVSTWSTCELWLSEADVETLLRELVGLPPEMFRRPPDWLGLALTVALAECGRRDANENDFWVPVSRRFKDAAWHRRVFTQLGQPTAFCRRLLEDAAFHYKLRNVYGRDDTMEWFVSMRLQFGFTRRGFEKRLHEWLVEAGVPLPLRFLRGAGENTALKADSFCKVWRHLWLFRKDQISEQQLRECLHGSPWILPEWHDELITKALKRREYDYVYEQRGEACDTDRWKCCAPDEDVADEGFLTRPRLVWERGAAPHFELMFEPEAIAWDRCEETEYSLCVGGERRGRVLRQSDGTYRAESDNIILHNPVSSIDAELKDGVGSTIADQRIDIWDGNAEAVVFDLTAGGLALPTENRPALKEGTEYAVLTAPDMTVYPETIERRTFAGRRIFRFIALANTPTVVSFEDGEEYVTLAVTECESVNLDGVHVELIAGEGAVPGGLALGIRYRVKVTIPRTVLLRRVRRDGATLLGMTAGAAWVSAPLDLTEEEHARGVRLQIVVAVGDETHSISRTGYAPVDGMALWEAGIDQAFTRSEAQDTPLHTDKARATQFLFRINGDAHGYFIFEGCFCHGRIKTKPSALKKLHGFGAPLTIGYSRFHTSGVESVSPAVLDTGILGEVDASGIELLHPLYISDGHRLVVVRPDWSVVSDHARMASDRNRLDANLMSGGWLAVGLFFKGHRQGAVWNTTDFSRRIAAATDPQRVARLTTLLKLPFLYPAFKKQMRSYLLAHPAVFLETWTTQGGRDIELDGKSFADPGLTGDEALRYSVCSLIGAERLNMSDEVCRDVVDAFGGDVDSATMQDLALLLDDVLDWSPRLAAQIARCAVAVDQDDLCHGIRKGTRKEVVRAVSRDTGIRETFIGRLVTSAGAGDADWSDNVARLLHHRTFRRLLTCFLISNPRV